MQEHTIQKGSALLNVSFSDLAVALASDYESIFLIDTENDNYVEYRMDSSRQTLTIGMQGTDFYSDTVRNTCVMIHPDDQEYFKKVFRKENMMDALSHSRSFSINYRLIVNGEPKYYFLKTIRGTGRDNRFITIGVRNVDDEVKRQMEAEKLSRTYSAVAKSLASLYEVIYYVNPETEEYIEYNSTEQFSKLGLFTDGKDFFRHTQEDALQVVHPDDRERVQKDLDKETLLQYLKTHYSFSITHRQLLDGKYQYVNLLAFKPLGEDKHIVVAVRNIDTAKRHELALTEESETYSHIAKSLSSRYEVIYYINTSTNKYTEYSCSDGYAKLGIKQKGDNFFESCAKDIKDYIHPDDQKDLLDSLDKENLLATLAEQSTPTVSSLTAERSMSPC